MPAAYTSIYAATVAKLARVRFGVVRPAPAPALNERDELTREKIRRAFPNGLPGVRK